MKHFSEKYGFMDLMEVWTTDSGEKFGHFVTLDGHRISVNLPLSQVRTF